MMKDNISNCPCCVCCEYEHCAGHYGEDICTAVKKNDTENVHKNNVYDNVENELDEYKYVLELSVNLDDPLDMNSSDMLCICDTRDECIEEIKKSIASYEEANKKSNVEITHDPYTITRLDCYIHYHCGDKSWWHSYGIYPVRYIHC